MSRKNQQNATVAGTVGPFGQYLADAERLCRLVAPRDLDGHAIYIVPQSRLADWFGQAESAYAYTTPSLDLYLQAHIDTWLGRGPCMVINDLAIAEDYEPEFHRDIVFNNVLHELAHILDRPQLFAERIDNQDLLLFESLVVANQLQHESESPTCGHGQSFVRIAIHLVARANRHGYDLRPAGVCRMHEFGLSPIGNYIDALGDEIAQHQSTHFRDFPEPAIQFTELWNFDTQSRGESA